MRVRSMRALAVGVMVALVVPLAPSAGAITVGNGAGCTPGFWKNHTKAWEEYKPSDTINTLGLSSMGEFSHLGNATLIEALSWSGGTTLEDMAKNLLKHTVTAFLNAAHDDLEYPYRRGTTGANGEPPLRTLVGDALASGDRAEMERVKNLLDAANNADCRVGKSENTNKKKKRKKNARRR